MLTVDLVRARQKGRELKLTELKGRSRARAHLLAETYLEVARSHVGTSRGAFEEACEAVTVGPRERKLALGIRKLVEDACEFETDESADSRALRRQIFELAAARRRSLGPGDRFDRAAILEEVANSREQNERVEQLEGWLFADLREAQILRAAPVTSAERLVESYDVAQAQAVLLRATRLIAEVECSSPATYRHLFGKLKFRRLLHTIHRRREGGYLIEIDGPYSLFSSVTKYGLQLALLLPALQLCDTWAIEAKLLWGKERAPLDFFLSGGSKKRRSSKDRHVEANVEATTEDLPEEVAELVVSFRKLDIGWRVERSAEILTLPGLGLCVPDLRFVHAATGIAVFLEVLGFWSREAVWQRVELVQGGLAQKIIFAVPKRLRVSEEVLDGDLPGALYVYKGKMSAKAISAKLEELIGR